MWKELAHDMWGRKRNEGRTNASSVVVNIEKVAGEATLSTHESISTHDSLIIGMA